MSNADPRFSRISKSGVRAGSCQQIVLTVSRFSRFSNSINRQQLKYQTNRPITCPMACAMACAKACAKVSWTACDVRPPQQPLKHQTKAPHGMRNYGMRQGMRQGMRHGMRYAMVFMCALSPGDAPARTFAKTYYSGPGRSLALIVVAEGRCR